jgi:hypothetical protein
MQEVASPKKITCRCVLGWLKQIFYVFCWIMTIIYAKYGKYEEEIYNYFYHDTIIRDNNAITIPFIISISFMGSIYIFSFVILCIYGSKSLELLNNTKENININKIMDTLFKEKPIVSINCMCYHNETRANTYYDAKGNLQTTHTTVVVQTYTESRTLNIFSYLDISGIFKLKGTTKKYIQLQLGKEINFNDELTLYDIQTIKNDLYTRNRFRDAYISVGINSDIPSFKEFFLIKLTKEESCFLQKWVYILFFILTLDGFYDLYLYCICSKQYFVIKKIVSSRQNVLENPKYSKFISGYNINEQNVILERNDIGGIDNQIEVKLPTEQEIASAKDYDKYIPQYIMKEDGEVINTNEKICENLMEIKEEKPQQSFENKGFEQSQKIEINTNYNSNEIALPLITKNNEN